MSNAFINHTTRGRTLRLEARRTSASPYAPKDKTLLRLEAEAKEAKAGLWIDADPVPPREYRKEGKKAAKTTAQQGQNERNAP